MNPLTQIIPGIRETRTPFAVGVLWTAAAFMLLSFAPPHVWQSSAMQALGHQLAKLPTEIAIAAAFFFIYLLGVVLELAGNAIRTLLWILPFLALIAGVPFPIIILLLQWQIWLLILPMMAGWIYLARRRMPGMPYRVAALHVLDDGGTLLLLQSKSFMRRMRQGLEPDYALFQELSRDEAEHLFSKDRGFFKEL